MTSFDPIYGTKRPSIWQKWRAKGEAMDDATFQRMIQGQNPKSVLKKSPFTGNDVIKNAIAGKLRDPNAPDIGFTKGMAPIPGFEGMNDEVDPELEKARSMAISMMLRSMAQQMIPMKDSHFFEKSPGDSS